MVTSNPMAVLGPKGIKPDSSKSLTKKAEEGFRDELIDREKKLKKKDPREAVPLHQQQVRQNEPSSPKASDKAPSEKPSSIERVDSQNVPAEQAGAQKQVAAPQQNAVAAPTTEGAEQAAAVVEMNVPNAQAQALLNAEGGIDLAGMQLQNPQVFAEAMAAVEAAAVEAPTAGAEEPNQMLKSALESLAAFEGVTGKEPAKDAEGKDVMMDLGSDAQTAGVPMKDPQQQIDFSKILDTKNTEASAQLKQTNVDNIITHAKTILKDGGGEMQVKLTPEGMGTVDLKVAVQNGNVSVEIMTQDDKVRRMFEDSIFDIRGALEGQNLKVEALKVGLSENIDQQMQQFNMNEREFARDFMGQFRDERQGLRSMAMANNLDRPGMQPKGPEGLAPAQQRPFPNGTGRLNVVI